MKMFLGHLSFNFFLHFDLNSKILNNINHITRKWTILDFDYTHIPTISAHLDNIQLLLIHKIMCNISINKQTNPPVFAE